MIRVTRMDGIRNDDGRIRTTVVRELVDGVDLQILSWFGHTERMNEGR